MEEILASIRRIISEDEPAPAASTEATTASPPHGDEQDLGDEDEDILELTERVEAPEPAYEPPSQTSGDLDIYERAAPVRPTPAPALAPDDYEDEPVEIGRAHV